MDEQEIRLACLGYAVDVAARIGGDVVKTAREIEEFVTGKLLAPDAAMIEAGVATYVAAHRYTGNLSDPGQAVEEIYRAMRAAAR